MTQNKEWLFQQLRKSNIPEGTGKWEDYEKAKETVGRRDQRLWDSLQGAVREYTKWGG